MDGDKIPDGVGKRELSQCRYDLLPFSPHYHCEVLLVCYDGDCIEWGCGSIVILSPKKIRVKMKMNRYLISIPDYVLMYLSSHLSMLLSFGLVVYLVNFASGVGLIVCGIISGALPILIFFLSIYILEALSHKFKYTIDNRTYYMAPLLTRHADIYATHNIKTTILSEQGLLYMIQSSVGCGIVGVCMLALGMSIVFPLLLSLFVLGLFLYIDFYRGGKNKTS